MSPIGRPAVRDRTFVVANVRPGSWRTSILTASCPVATPDRRGSSRPIALRAWSRSIVTSTVTDPGWDSGYLRVDDAGDRPLFPTRFAALIGGDRSEPVARSVGASSRIASTAGGYATDVTPSSTISPTDREHVDRTSLRAPLVVCGVGFGGFFDGIVFHQVLQTHHMLSNSGDDRLGLDPRPVDTVAGLEVNTLWDGLFHACTYVALLIGVIWLGRRWHAVPAVRPPWRLLIGGLLVGWGLFNVVEGVVNHHVLAIHHVVETGPVLVMDVLFLAAGAVMLGVGSVMIRPTGDRRSAG